MVDRGAKVNVVNKRGQTPWRITQGEYRSGSFLTDQATDRERPRVRSVRL
jgi:hypothetical protein